MKHLHFIILFLLTPLIFFGQTQNLTTQQIDIKNTNIEWVGKKVTGSHNGIIQIQDGFIETNREGEILKGAFTINMNSITCTDLTGSKKNYFEEHLKNEDFFNTKEYPQAFFVIKKCTKDIMEGELTIKNITKNVSFSYQKINKSTYTATIIIDRTLFDIHYKSKSIFPIKYADNFIYDDFTITLNPISFK